MHTESPTGQRIHDDHHRVVALLNDLEAFLDGTRDDDAPALAAAPDRRLLAALEAELGAGLADHFDTEEELFPAIAAAGGHELTADLMADHAALRPLATRLARLSALALRDGFDEESWAVFRSFSRNLIEGLVLHIQKEETTLLAVVDALLLPAEEAQPR